MVVMENYGFLVSILCETYNQSQYITDTLDGFVVQQTTFPFVAVVIDDASTDGEQSVIKDYIESHFDCSMNSDFRQWETEDAYWTFARHLKNKSCYFVAVFLKKNLYEDMEKKEIVVKDWFNSKYKAICEGDDYWTDSQKLQKQVDFLELHEDYSMCCSAFSQTFDGQEGKKQIVQLDLAEISVDDLLKERWIGTLTTLFRTEWMLDYTPPFPNLPFGDLPMWFHLAMKGKIKYLKDVTANYRRLKESACHFTDSKKDFVFSLEAMRVREYYALLANKVDIAQPVFSRKSHYYLEECYKNKWFDFPMDTLWHFVKEYGHPSGYDKLRYWGMKSMNRYRISKWILETLKKRRS